MDLRTKFVFAMVAVALGSMGVLGVFAYDAVRDLLKDVAVRQLDAVAESKKQELEQVVVAWRDRVKLLATRPSLRQSLAAHRREREPAARAEAGAAVDAELRDALRSLHAFRGIVAYTAEGFPISHVGFAPGADARVHPAAFFLADDPVAYDNVTLDAEGHLVLSFVAPVHEEGRKVGALKVLLAAQELIAVAADRTGLGETGETVLGMRVDDGGALVVNPLRHLAGAPLRLHISEEQQADPLLRAVKGQEVALGEGAIDYRGEEVWAATRFVDTFDWGLVVKVDAEEEERLVSEIRDTLLRLTVSLSAFAVLVGTGLGLWFARPIRELARVAQRIGDGELDLCAETRGEDEVALLAASFNRMARQLVEKNRALEALLREERQKHAADDGES